MPAIATSHSPRAPPTHTRALTLRNLPYPIKPWWDGERKLWIFHLQHYEAVVDALLVRSPFLSSLILSFFFLRFLGSARLVPWGFCFVALC